MKLQLHVTCIATILLLWDTCLQCIFFFHFLFGSTNYPRNTFKHVNDMMNTVGDKIKFPLCTDSPPTCERSCQQKSPKSRPKVASDFRRTLNVIKNVADLFLSGEKIVCARIQFIPKSRACANGTRRSCNYSY